MSYEINLDHLEKIMKCCGPPNTDSYLKYTEKIRHLFSKLSKQLAVKIQAIEGVEKSVQVAESLVLQDHYDGLTNLSMENQEKVITGFQENCVQQQTAIAKQKKFIKSLSKTIKMLSSLELLYQKPLKILIKFQAPYSAAELKYRSDLRRLSEDAAKIDKLQKLSDTVSLKYEEVATELIEPMMVDVMAQFSHQFKKWKLDCEARDSFLGPWSKGTQTKATKESLRLLEVERDAAIEKSAILESWNTMQMSALKGDKERLSILIKRLKEDIQENERVAPMDYGNAERVFAEYGSLLDDYTNLVKLLLENRNLKMETIRSQIEILKQIT